MFWLRNEKKFFLNMHTNLAYKSLISLPNLGYICPVFVESTVTKLLSSLYKEINQTFTIIIKGLYVKV